jgi:serine/threonine-protein phosphatase 2B catalytic subunit
LRTKVRAVAKMARLFKNLKNNSEILLEIKEMAPDGKIPRGLLMKGRPAIKDKFKEFLLARDLDKDNEKRPIIHSSKVLPSKIEIDD